MTDLHADLHLPLQRKIKPNTATELQHEVHTFAAVKKVRDSLMAAFVEGNCMTSLLGLFLTPGSGT